MMEELKRKQRARELAAMTPEERAKLEEVKKPVQTGDVAAKLAMFNE
jgi:hypothetical protein